MDEKDREIQKTREYNYVLWTIIVVLAIMLVNLFAQQTCDNKKFVDQVSFASTISSIILSVIAIIMTVISSDSMNSLLHKFRDLCDVLQNTPSKIETSMGSIKESSEKLQEVENKIKDLPQILNNNQEVLNGILSSIKETIGQLDGKILEIKSETTSMRMELSDVSNKMSGNIQKKILQKTIASNDLKDIMLKSMSYYHLCLLYAIKIAYNNKKKLSIPLLANNLSVRNLNDYFFSFLLSLTYFGIITVNGFKEDAIEILSVDDVILDEIDMAIDNFTLNREKVINIRDISLDKENIRKLFE